MYVRYIILALPPPFEKKLVEIRIQTLQGNALVEKPIKTKPNTWVWAQVIQIQV